MGSSTPITIFQNPSKLFAAVTDEELNSFHHIDRMLFLRLISNLHRDPKESMQVMAFWLWFERDVVDDLTLVYKMLALPASVLNSMVEESVMCLRCGVSETFPFSGSKQELYYLRNFVQKNITYRYFYDNRIWVVKGVAKMFNGVCFRAFHDILDKTNDANGIGYVPFGSVGLSKTTIPQIDIYNKDSDKTVTPSTVSKSGSEVRYLNKNIQAVGGLNDAARLLNVTRENLGNPNLPSQPAVGYGMLTNASQVFPLQTLSIQGPSEQKQDPDDDLDQFHQIFRNKLNFIEKENDSLRDERTIFLTFSKGYPIAEAEVHEFFTRKFGNIIESIYMQEVSRDEQVLFARVVVRSSIFVNAVVEGGKAKYIINGKHVWARRYVRNNHKSPSLPPPVDVAGPSYVHYNDH